MAPSSRDNMPTRACDACRTRKVKCDALTSVCSNCRISNLSCTFSTPPQRRGRKPKFPYHVVEADGSQSQSQLGRSTPSHRDGHLDAATSSPATGNNASIDDMRGIGTAYTSPSTAGDTPSSFVTATAASGELPPESTTERCIDLFMQFVFPIIPIIHEPTLRCQAMVMCRRVAQSATSPLPIASIAESMKTIEDVRFYSLLTALCALVAYIFPKQIFPDGDEPAAAYLSASQRVLGQHAEEDLSNPTSSSIVIRIIHAGSLHLAGKPDLSWHMLHEAMWLVQQMRLYDEASYDNLDPIEARIRRRAFFHLCSADKSASLLNGRPQMLDEFHLRAPITAKFCRHEGPLLLDPGRVENEDQVESLLLEGCKKDSDLWALASDILFDLRLLKTWQSRSHDAAQLSESHKLRLMEAYLQFTMLLDDLSECLASPEKRKTSDEGSTRYQRRQLWSQHTNIYITYHYLRLTLMDRFVTDGLSHLLGLNDDPTMLAWRMTEIVRDLLSVVDGLPLEVLQTSGEPCVEKIRFAGVILLKIINNAHSQQIIERARLHVTAVLDRLSKLKSRVSENLAVNTDFSPQLEAAIAPEN
ncbi:hypothetical protein B0J13DRAFT_133980 [Dactylonectria estremocensis]|uniref:Zn(2)-C6 fungal-type domain-containing protein n=1 Tax=Dactylonectria estremocensis TaxID=1079267 RepID=A0A9P9E0I5_9HYPO|nr:hypothetical protein B0J13DRAFT_133980 [Dactylonectria estremocensis]